VELFLTRNCFVYCTLSLSSHKQSWTGVTFLKSNPNQKFLDLTQSNVLKPSPDSTQAIIDTFTTEILRENCIADTEGP